MRRRPRGGSGSVLDLVLWDVERDAQERAVAEMIAAAAALASELPEVSAVMCGRGFLPDPGSGQKTVDRSLLRPRQEPRPYHLVGESPRFGIALEFADAAAFDSYSASDAWASFVQRFAPRWTRAWHLPMAVEWG